MRTTIILPDELYESVKARARAEGRTMTALIEQALRERLATPPGSVAPFVVHPFDGTGTLPGVDLADSADLLARMEA